MINFGRRIPKFWLSVYFWKWKPPRENNQINLIIFLPSNASILPVIWEWSILVVDTQHFGSTHVFKSYDDLQTRHKIVRALFVSYKRQNPITHQTSPKKGTIPPSLRIGRRRAVFIPYVRQSRQQNQPTVPIDPAASINPNKLAKI